MTEKRLLDRFIDDGDQDAFQVIIDRHGPMVLGVCRSVLRDSHDVEDALGDVHVACQNRPQDQESRLHRGVAAPGVPPGRS